MGLIRVEASQLKTQAEELKSLNASFKSVVGELENSEGQLNSSWDGEANDAFHNAFQRDKTQMNNFYDAIENYVYKLQEIAAKYEEAESKNTETAANRSY